MIQEADIGVGIMGQEGGQAASAADFSISQFQVLAPLILRFGRIAYLNVSKFILYFFYKNFLMTMVQFVFGFFSAFSAVTFFDWNFISYYNTLFTVFAIPALSVNDVDFDSKQYSNIQPLLLDCYLYYIGQRHLKFNLKQFLKYILLGTL